MNTDNHSYNYLKETALLNFNHSSITQLIESKQWLKEDEYTRIGLAYDFVRNEIQFGYNTSDDLTAAQILNDGYGQCNTKGTLLMALFRGLNIPCRLHGFTIDKGLQRGVVPELIYPIVPNSIIHSWVEIYFYGNWINLEGFILDDVFLAEIRKAFGKNKQSLCSFGAGTKNINNPQVEWKGEDTYIQKTGINNDFGIYDSPDDFYKNHQQDFPWWKKLIYKNIIRHWMNRRVEKIRNGQKPKKVPNIIVDYSF